MKHRTVWIAITILSLSYSILTGSLFSLVLTVGGLYMIFNYWQDKTLSKWQTIFTTVIFTVVTVFVLYIIVKMLNFIFWAGF